MTYGGQVVDPTAYIYTMHTYIHICLFVLMIIDIALESQQVVHSGPKVA